MVLVLLRQFTLENTEFKNRNGHILAQKIEALEVCFSPPLPPTLQVLPFLEPKQHA